MPPAPRLTEAEIATRLGTVRNWRRDGETIVKAFHFRDFMEALRFVQRVAEPAEEQNHHPDVAIHWNEVTLSLWTHASGGITERDFRLAASIDALTEDQDAET